MCYACFCIFFFFQAEDGIRDWSVTGVQTCALPIWLTVPPHRKVNRSDRGTADKLCVAALAIWDQARRLGVPAGQTSFVLVELGGVFTAALAVDRGQVVDGIGGTTGGLGYRGLGTLDGELAYALGSVRKSLLFSGGAAFVAGDPEPPPEELAARAAAAPRAHLAWGAPAREA